MLDCIDIKKNYVSKYANTGSKSFGPWLVKWNEIQSIRAHFQAIFKRSVEKLGAKTRGLKMARTN
jgi:hypothetical protein